MLSVTSAGVPGLDGLAFAGLAESHRQELRVHCQRMIGSYHDSEDLVQEALLRAWASRGTFQGRSTFRAWLYRIATNACLDFLQRTNRRHQRHAALPDTRSRGVPTSVRGAGEAIFSDQPLGYLPAADPAPEEAAVSRETVALVVAAAMQHLPPRQRTVLLLRDVLGWPAADTAAHLQTSVAAANSALQRARATLRQRLPARRTDWRANPAPTRAVAATVCRYIDAIDRADPSVFGLQTSTAA
jgi:RNA polymerase sigma-70 factor (ECF subfamily)